MKKIQGDNMKKILMIFISFMLTTGLQAQSFKEWFSNKKETATQAIEKVAPKKCAVTNDTPLREIKRPIYEMGAVFNVFDFPDGGEAQARIENVNLSLIVNLGPTFHAYTWAGSRNTKKNEYTYPAGSDEYDEEWTSTMIFAGFGLYLVPQFRIFAGAGQVTMENNSGDPPNLNTGIEYGAGWSEDFYGNRIEIAYKAIIAGVSGDNVPVEDSIASGSHNSISIGLYFPLGGE
jgi:hypothetical protein